MPGRNRLLFDSDGEDEKMEITASTEIIDKKPKRKRKRKLVSNESNNMTMTTPEVLEHTSMEGGKKRKLEALSGDLFQDHVKLELRSEKFTHNNVAEEDDSGLGTSTAEFIDDSFVISVDPSGVGHFVFPQTYSPLSPLK